MDLKICLLLLTVTLCTVKAYPRYNHHHSNQQHYYDQGEDDYGEEERHVHEQQNDQEDHQTNYEPQQYGYNLQPEEEAQEESAEETTRDKRNGADSANIIPSVITPNVKSNAMSFVSQTNAPIASASEVATAITYAHLEKPVETIMEVLSKLQEQGKLMTMIKDMIDSESRRQAKYALPPKGFKNGNSVATNTSRHQIIKKK